MKAVVISDIHGSGYYADRIKEINERENPDKIIVTVAPDGVDKYMSMGIF